VFEFDAAWAFVLLPAPLLVWVFLPPYREQRDAVRVPFFEGLAAASGQRPARGGVQLKKSALQMLVAPLVWLLVVTALAKPQLVEPPIEKIESARDLVLAVDLSGSMATADMQDASGNRIDRLTAVKQVLGDFVERREGDRIAILVFGNQAFLQAPFTQDRRLLRTLLDQTAPRMAGPQTVLGDAIGLSIRTFESSTVPERVLILLTDGNDSGSRMPPRKAAEIAAGKNISIYTIGVGDPATIGEAEIDAEMLQDISAASGGTSYRADDRAELEAVYRQIDSLTPVELETTSYRPTRPLFHWPLGAAILLILAFETIMCLRLVAAGWKTRRA
jgi:Ca-activated chloride channel family protein